ncbi:MAG TPA: hypothetical protein VNH11_14030 [Pirellulales bacterium]|nr:hypothetical protein [Pirellulales bacterium]
MTHRHNNRGQDHVADCGIRCANCGSLRVTTTEVDDKFDYGEGPSAVSLQVRVPLRICQECGFQFLDEEAEDPRQEVIAEHQAALHLRGG